MWLGHCNPAIAAALRQQLNRAWLVGGLTTGLAEEAKVVLESFFPTSHKLAGFCSTGMEAAEFALRIARVHSGRLHAAAFDRSMHGKSLAMAQLAWDNHDGVDIPFLHRLSFLSTCSESEILQQACRLLAGREVSAVFVEPLQGSGGGHAASKDFYRKLFDLCRETGTLLIFDEILTGFYRTGSPFFFSDLGFVPDMVLVGKAIGNGFPVSGVVARQRCRIQPAMLAGSTYAGNPLACCAVLNTLRQMQSINLPRLVADIENTIVDSLRPLKELSIALRGKGAIWILQLPGDRNYRDLVLQIYERGVCVGFAGQQIRILPPATIELEELASACGIVCEVLYQGLRHA